MKLKVIFSKTGDMKFISHLDLVRMFQRALRRMDAPVTITKGFSPRLKISITKALKLGLESSAEEAIFYMDKEIDAGKFIESINAKLPNGVRVKCAQGDYLNHAP